VKTLVGGPDPDSRGTWAPFLPQTSNATVVIVWSKAILDPRPGWRPALPEVTPGELTPEA